MILQFWAAGTFGQWLAFRVDLLMTVRQVVFSEQCSEEFPGSTQATMCCGLPEKGDLSWSRAYCNLLHFDSVHGFSSPLGHVNAQPAAGDVMGWQLNPAFV
jgi:hypothetical protein